ncbi:T9SS type A sorting domain-containing protein [Apibacter muscae]|uniref:T9SS type A sorting domain-containing protein n=1 Tax=Apibacter muscae TaxID=2509004 RepID=UPI0011AC747A|nr:T9SS type A sorting domain-containing protein [Apibacter muscae]TWP22997.1 T9SS type A sorting domain-containing protein [Apibacter muscae]
MKKLLFSFMVLFLTLGIAQSQKQEEPLELEFRSGNTTSNYKGVKIGEYYWMDASLYEPVLHYTTQNFINKHMDGWAVPYDMPAESFNRYYGQFYGPMEVPSGDMYENGVVDKNWKLPNRAAFYQLMAMCGTGSYQDIKEYLGAKTNDNPMAVNLTASGDISNGHWFAPNKNVYGFSLMPGGGRMNGPWQELAQGDFYAMYKHAKLRVDDWSVFTVDNLEKTASFSGVLYHWINIRWAKRIPDEQLGYKLYIKESDYKKYEYSELIPNFDINSVDIKKLSLDHVVPNGYIELPNGWIRGFYIQKNGTQPIKKMPELTTHLRILTDDNKYVFRENDQVKFYLRTDAKSQTELENLNFGLYNPKNGDFRGPIKILSVDGYVYTCELPENNVNPFMLVPYIEQNGEKIILKRGNSTPWIDRLPITIEYKLSRGFTVSSDFQANSNMQINIPDGGTNRLFQIELEKPFMIRIETKNQEQVRIGLFYTNGDFYTDITNSVKGSVYTCSLPNSVQAGDYILMPYTKEDGKIKVVERNDETFYMDRLPIVALEEDIWGDSFSAFSVEEPLTPYTQNNNTLYIKGLSSTANLSIIDINGTVKKQMNNITQNTAIPISDLKSGVYFIKVNTSEGKVENLKFIKQ